LEWRIERVRIRKEAVSHEITARCRVEAWPRRIAEKNTEKSKQASRRR
jgi:hypothetical protein